MSYSSKELVQMLYPKDKISELQWMVDDLECYSTALPTFAGWQVTLKDRHFSKRAGGWIEVDNYGKLLLRQMVA